MYRILILIILGLSMACNNSGSTEESKKLYDEIMKIHDEVMPKMGDIRKLSKQLKKIEDYQSIDSIVVSLNDLDNAHESMMGWMAQFKMPKEISNEEEMEFLNSQMKSVTVMKNTMLSALDRAEKEISKYLVQ
tara:strand:+ start:122 stop:520 length:399 start_codon:yes stop_codon:yes gene_type:complete